MIRFEVAPIRPRVATVVAVVWIYVGVCWLLTGLFMLLGGLQLVRIAGSAEWLGFAPAFAVGIVVSGAMGLRGAFGLLRLKERGRALVEWANWLSFAGFILFTLTFCNGFARTIGYFGSSEFDPSRAILPFFMGSSFAVPFLIMARKLRSQEVRYAVRDTEMRGDY